MKTAFQVQPLMLSIALAWASWSAPGAGVGEAIADKARPKIADLCPGATVSAQGGELSVKLLTHTVRRHFTTLKDGEVVPGEFADELPQAAGFMTRLAFRPGPYFEQRGLGAAPDFEGRRAQTNGVYHTAAAVEFPKADYVYMVADISLGEACDAALVKRIYKLLLEEAEGSLGQPSKEIAGRARVGPAARTQYFEGLAGDLPEGFRLIPGFSGGKFQTLSGSGGPSRIAAAFSFWVHRLLAPWFGVDEAFVSANLRLMPGLPGRESVVAWLPCRFHEADYLVFQTGGASGVFGLVTAIRNGMEVRSEQEAELVLLRTMERYASEARGFLFTASNDLLPEARPQHPEQWFTRPRGESGGLALNVQKQGELYHIDLRQPAGARGNRWGLAEGIVSDRDVALLFRKDLHSSGGRVPESAKREWLLETDTGQREMRPARSNP